MDKLEPILKQKFWILLGVGVIVTIVGWWMAAGSLAATITARKDALDKVEGSIPSGEMPNESWSKQLAEINGRQQIKVEEAKLELWKRQEARMFWPHPKIKNFAKEVGYEKDFDIFSRELYRETYDEDAKRVWLMVRPFIPLDGSGIVMFPIMGFPHQSPGQLTPNSKEMWERQQDLWLLEPIMQAILAVNLGENATRADASIHAIVRLELIGGDRDKMPNTGTGTGTGAGVGQSSALASAEGEDMMSILGGAAGAYGSGAYGAAGGAGVPGSADFDPKEEYGDGGTPGVGGYGRGMLAASSASGFTEDEGSGTMAAAGGASAPVIRRYVDDAETLPYKTRAFYLSVIMDHRKVPDLIGALTANGDSDWPIEISRVQVVRLNPDEGTGTAGAGNLAMGEAGAYGGSGGYGGANSPFGGGGAGAFTPFGGGGAGFAEPAEDVPSNTLGGFGAGTYGSGGLAPGSGMGIGGRHMGGPGSGMDTTFADPSLAKVALCGLIYIYKPVQPPATPAAEPAAPAAETPASETEAMPAESTEPPATPSPSDAPTDPDAPQPAATSPETEPAAP